MVPVLNTSPANKAVNYCEILVRPATAADRTSIWRVIEPVIRAGETYTLPRDLSEAHALSYWFSSAHEVFVAEIANEIVGSYYLRPNQSGGGSHVAGVF